MGIVHVINVVHTEQDWWDGELRGIDLAMPAFLRRLEQLEHEQGVKVPLTWCLYFGNDTGAPDIVDVRREFFWARWQQGDEIGIHTHAADHRHQPRYIKANAEKLAAAGFPYPKTHAPGWFYLNSDVIRALEDAGIEIDAGLYVRENQFLHPETAILLQDATCRDATLPASFRPYHPDSRHVCLAGDSPVVEAPIFFPLEGREHGWNCRGGILENPGCYVEAFVEQWQHRHEVAVDIVQFYWHPFELLWTDDAGNAYIDQKVVDGLCQIFSEIASLPDVVFSTTQNAVDDWKHNL
jgi:hypothetical protein